MRVPRITPICGETTKYDAALACQFSVTLAPELMIGALAVKLLMLGTAPCGTFDAV